jgi:serine-type D-Ala-D-Ala carboxypeptidase/endopeptidase (penicillin-binding protein 4)
MRASIRSKVVACCWLFFAQFPLIGMLLVASPSIFPPGPAAQSSTPSGRAPSAGIKNQGRPDITRFEARVNAILAQAQASRTFWGISVADRDTGQTLYELNADHYFTPGSNAKIVTTSFALAALGPQYRFRTTLESSGSLDAQGRLQAELVLVGRGDPDLSNRRFPYSRQAERDGPVDRVLTELAEAVVAKGLKEVEGPIIADDSYFPYDPYPAQWTAGDLFFTFGAPVSALAFNENVFSLQIQSGALAGDKGSVVVEPSAAADTFGQEINTVASNLQPDLSVVRQPGPAFTLIRGSVPAGHGPVRLDLAMTEPAETAARALRQELEALGVRVTGGVGVKHAAPPARSARGPLPASPSSPDMPLALLLAEHLSPPLIESIRLANKISQNLHTELFLRTAAREKAGVGSSDQGLELEQDFLKAAGIPGGDIRLSDGSGLARDDLVKPRALVQLLRYAVHQTWGPDFLSTLPVAGVDGTLEGRLKKPTVAGLIQAKTGSLDHVHALSGYATTLTGEYLAFSILGNNDVEQGGDPNTVLDAIATAMVETLGAPAVSQQPSP